MRVALTWARDPLMTGMGRYAQELMAVLPADAVEPREVARREVTVLGRPLGGYLSVWLQRIALGRPRDGLLHALDPSVAPWGRRGADVLTVHDLIPYKFLHLYQRGLLQALGHAVNLQGILAARRIIVPSRHVQGDVVRLCGREPEGVTVIPEGVDLDRFRPVEVEREERTVLFVGDNNPRKNLVRLVEGLGRLDPPVRFVRIGQAQWRDEERRFRAAARRAGVEVVEPGWASDEELVAWYNRAGVFAFPTLDEGFGLPPLEALACGTPAVVSDIPPHRETLGRDAVFVDPWDPEAIAAGIEEALGRSWDRTHLRRRARRYTWDRCAEATVEVYRDLGLEGV